MPDVYTTITETPPALLERIMMGLELRAADPQQRAMLDTYLRDAAIPQSACVFEAGCDTGAVTRVLAAWPGVATALKAEARRRSPSGEYFGHIAYLSCVARKPE
jgi:hypothetical protein